MTDGIYPGAWWRKSGLFLQQNVMLLQQSNLDPAQSVQEMYQPTSNCAAMHVWTEILPGP